MTETDDLTALRSAVAQLDQAEKLALATYLTGTSNPKFQGLVNLDMDKLTAQLAEVCELSAIFPTDTRIFFAIELLQFCQDEEEDDGLPDPADYDDEEEENYPESTRINGAYRTPDGDEYEEGTDDHYGVDVQVGIRRGGRTSAPEDFDIRTKWRFEDGV